MASMALGWSFFNNAFARFGTLAIGIALARLLGPHQFGTFAVALLALLALLSFNELGVSLAIVRWEGDPREIAPTVTTISVLSSVVIYAGAFLAAPAFAKAMGAPAAASVIRILGLNIVIDGVVATPAALMQRFFRQDRKIIADQVNCWLGAAVSILLAWRGFGAMSLAIGRMAGALASGVLFVVFSPEPLRFGFDREKARALFNFGMPLAAASIVVFAVTNVDQLVVGRMLGATALGFYALAFNLSSWPVSMFSLPVRSVAPAVFSRLQADRPAMRASFESAAGLLGSITLPVCFLISGLAVPLLRLVYGDRWVPAAQALEWLAVLGALRILFEFIYDFFVVLARSRVVFTIQLVWLAALVPALIAGTMADGIAGAAMAEVAVAVLVVMPWYLSELSKVGIRRRGLAAKLSLPLIAALLVAVASATAARVVPSDLGACLVGGGAALLAIGLLTYRMREAIATLRPTLGVRDGLQPASTMADSSADAPAPAVSPAVGVETGNPVAPTSTQRDTRALPVRSGVSIPGPSWRDVTGPLPIYRPADDITVPLPVYRPPRIDESPDRGTAPTVPLVIVNSTMSQRMGRSRYAPGRRARDSAEVMPGPEISDGESR